MKTIAFVGLGAMGRPMARNLIKAGFAVQGYDVNPAGLADLKAAGGVPTGSAKEAFVGAGAIVLMVVNAAQAEAVLFSNGALEAAPAETIVCLMATCPPKQVQAIAERVAMTGRRFVDSPVSGGVVGATAGSLTILAAAPKDLLESVRPMLEAMGSRTLRVGDKPGQGATVKTINQLLCGVHIVVAAEALSLAEKIGVDTKSMLDILVGTSAGSWMLKDRGPPHARSRSGGDERGRHLRQGSRHRARSWPGDEGGAADDRAGLSAFQFDLWSRRRYRR